jgi:hypothetical protein
MHFLNEILLENLEHLLTKILSNPPNELPLNPLDPVVESSYQWYQVSARNFILIFLLE